MKSIEPGTKLSPEKLLPLTGPGDDAIFEYIRSTTKFPSEKNFPTQQTREIHTMGMAF